MRVGYVFDTKKISDLGFISNLPQNSTLALTACGGKMAREGGVNLILCNLVFHELDCFVEKLLTYDINLESRLNRGTLPLETRDRVKHYYVRYANEWLIGVGSCQSQDVVQIKSKIQE